MDTAVNNAVVHHRFTRALHWASALAIVIGVGAIFAREYVEPLASRAFLLALHQGMGLLVLSFAMIRLTTRWPLKVGQRNSYLAMPLRLASALEHLALYCNLLALPIIGWLLTNARGQVAYLLWLVPLPALTERDRDYADTLQDWHTNAAWILLILVTTHVAAALYHHFVRRDNVLRSMLPFLRPAGAAPVENKSPSIDLSEQL